MSGRKEVDMAHVDLASDCAAERKIKNKKPNALHIGLNKAAQLGKLE